MKEFGGDGYLVFFGVLEVYSREFSTEIRWKLDESLSYFCHTLLISPKKFKKIMSKITKWEVTYSGDKISIFIPKFKELMDESTIKKIRSHEKSFRNLSGIVPKSEATEEEEEEDKERKKERNEPGLFEIFWHSYPTRNGQKVGKSATLKLYNKLKNGERELLLQATKNYADSKTVKDGFAKDPQRFLRDNFWKDWIVTKIQEAGSRIL